MKQYTADHWRTWLGAAALGMGIALVAPWVPGNAWVGKFLAFEKGYILLWVWLIFVLVLTMVSPHAIDFGHRLRRTALMQRPPLLYVDVIVITAVSFGFTITTLVYSDTIAAPVISHAMDVFLRSVFAALLFWLFALIGPLHRQQTPAISTTSPMKTVGDHSDEPIRDDSQDLLGRTIFVDKLYEQIAQLPFPQSFVFGLHAGWGEGKTSVLNLLYIRLNNNPRVIPIVYNPWYLATETALIQSFYASIERALQSSYLIVGLRRTLSRYRDLLSSGLRSLGFGLELPIRDDPGRLRAEIESWVTRTGCRLVILIDDIDRLQASEVLSVFKLVALSARLQNTVFLLSFDQIVIRKMLKDSADIDPAFLEKVIQKPLQLPPAEQQDIDRFLLLSNPDGSGGRSAIDRLLDEIGVDANTQREFRQEIDSFYHIRLRGLFRTVRQAKRYINSLRATLPAIVNEIDLYDFALLEIIQVFSPKVYQDIWRSYGSYVPPWPHTAMLSFPVSRAHNEEEKYRRSREHIEELLRDEPQADVIKDILEELFFVEVPKAFRRSGGPIRRQGTKTYREAKRLTHPDCFPKYFLYRLPKEEKLSDQAVEDLIRQWSQTSESCVEGLVEESLRQNQAAGQLPELLLKLRTFMALIAPAHIAAIVRGLCRSVPFLSREFILSGYHLVCEYWLVEELVLWLIEERADAAIIQSLLEIVVEAVPNLHFAVLIVASCHGRRGATSSAYSNTKT